MSCLRFVFTDMGSQIVLIDHSNSNRVKAVARIKNPLWKEYERRWYKHHTNVPCAGGGTAIKLHGLGISKKAAKELAESNRKFNQEIDKQTKFILGLP